MSRVASLRFGGNISLALQEINMNSGRTNQITGNFNPCVREQWIKPNYNVKRITSIIRSNV